MNSVAAGRRWLCHACLSFSTALLVAAIAGCASPGAVHTPKVGALTLQLASDPGNGWLYLDRAHAYAVAQNRKMARRDIEEGLKHNDTGDIHSRAGWCYFLIGDHKAALREWQKAGELNKFQKHYDYYTLAIGYWANHDFIKAMEFYDKAVARNQAFADSESLARYTANWTEKEKKAIRSVFDMWRHNYVLKNP